MSRKSMCTRSTKEVSQIVNKTCRTCSLYFDEESNLLPLWKEMKGMTKENDKFFIIDELKLINVGVEEDNELPQKICRTCVDLVQSVHAFRLLVQDSQISLRKRFCHKKNLGMDNFQFKEEYMEDYDEIINSASLGFNFIDVSNTKIKEEDVKSEMSSFDGDFNAFDDFDENSNSSINGNEKKFGCWYCEEAFVSADERQKHEKDHKEERPKLCKICKKRWKSRYDYTVHLRTHEVFPYTTKVCERCGEVLKNGKRLYHHLSNNLCNRIRKLPKATVETSTDSTDKKKKKKEANYKCPFCEKKFIIPQGLQKHIKLHDKSRKYRCNLCDLGYTRNDHLLRHMNDTHLKTKTYACTLCDRVFLHEEARQRHLKYHVKKTYTCEDCGKKFQTEESKKVHLRMHTGVKKYACVVCEEKFITKQSLTCHQSKHTKEQHQYASEAIVAKALMDETTDSVKGE